MFRDHEFRRTIVAVILIGIVTFTGAAIYDRFSGGPEARQASIDAKAVLDGFQDLQERSECVTTYNNADNIAQANLLLAFGVLIETAGRGQDVTQEQADAIHDARVARREYLVLRADVNELCDPHQRGGPKPLPDEDQPVIIDPEELLVDA